MRTGEISIQRIPVSYSLEHTMSHSLERYVEQKLPTDLLEHVAANRIPIVVENHEGSGFLPNQIDFSEHFQPAEIIYFGKLGTLTAPSDIYEKIFTPSQFLMYNCLTKLGPTITLKNSMAQFNDNGLVGVHASVPTIMEETFMQRQYLERSGVESIDNEIAFIAREIHRFNARTSS